MAKDEKRPVLPRPLYGAVGPVEFSRSEANTGLWYDKFVNQWSVEKWPDRNAESVSWNDFIEESRRSSSKVKLHIEKLSWIKTVTGPIGCPKLIEEFADRQRQLAERSRGKVFLFKTEGRFATGLGREHPIENGFAWHHTLGTPYLPGSSIKGLIRNWAKQWEKCDAEANQVLGSPGSVGRVLLLDALPTMPPVLEPDVMTPHYGEYFQSRGSSIAPPGDWLSPTPIPFLVVAAGQTFQFAIVPNDAADEAYLDTVRNWLIEALRWLGAGAKTAVGYGRFQRDLEAEQRIEQEAHARVELEADRQAQEARLSGLSPELQQLVKLAESEHWTADRSKFLDGLERYLQQMPNPTAPVIEWLRDNCFEKHWKGIWSDPDAKRGKRGDKFKHESKRARELTHRLKSLVSK